VIDNRMIWLQVVALVGVRGVMDIYSPSHLKGRLSDVQYSLASFGDIPFGKTVMGPLVVESGTACDADSLKDYK
jgi:hypothetical protein